MKKLFLAFLITAFLLTAASCANRNSDAGVEVGPALEANIARVYTPSSRESRFVINGVQLDGSVIGKAYFDAAADGRTALAWVDTVLYFVSEKGVDRLGAGIGTAELSFDGKYAFYLMDGQLYKYSLESRESEVVDTGLESVVQFAISPSSETVMYTATYLDAPGAFSTKLLAGGEVKPALEGVYGAVLAVSDDAKTVWYYDASAGFCVDRNGEKTVVSTECSAATNYNFTNDLDEVIFSTSDDRQIWYRLGDGSSSELGTGFGYSLKTEVYSISKVSLFSYINDVSSFENGLFMLRNSVDGQNLYTVGLLSPDGKLSVLAENALMYKAAPDGTRVVWLSGDGLYSTDVRGTRSLISAGAVDFCLSADGSAVYYLSNDGSLLCDRDGKVSEIEKRVSSLAMFNGCLVYLRADSSAAGTLFSAPAGESPSEIMNGVTRFDARHGQLLVYSDPIEDGSKTTYTLHISTDGRNYAKIADGVEP